MYKTNYRVAVEWLDGNLILCNQITEVDPSVWDNMRFSIFEEDEDGYENQIEIYQYFLTSYSDDDVEYLEEHFDLKFTYSDLLGLWVLCVTHWGTGWDYVYWETDLPQAKAELGERK